jgi:hypothetical protein
MLKQMVRMVTAVQHKVVCPYSLENKNSIGKEDILREIIVFLYGLCYDGISTKLYRTALIALYWVVLASYPSLET